MVGCSRKHRLDAAEEAVVAKAMGTSTATTVKWVTVMAMEAALVVMAKSTVTAPGAGVMLLGVAVVMTGIVMVLARFEMPPSPVVIHRAAVCCCRL